METTNDERPRRDDRGGHPGPTTNANSNVELQTQDGLLSLRLSRRAIALRLLPLVLAPIVFIFLVWGPGQMAFGRDPWFRNGILAYGLVGQAAYLIYVLRDRLVPYVVDVPANTLRRGKRVICALSDIESIGVTIRSGRNQTYFVALTLRDAKETCRLFGFVFAGQAHEAVSALAARLNVPARPDQREGVWRRQS